MYDDIESFLYSKSAIDSDTKFLVNYISNIAFNLSEMLNKINEKPYISSSD